MSEVQRIKERYARRKQSGSDSIYSPLSPFAYMVRHEKERALVRWIKTAGLTNIKNKSVLEVGCGFGTSLGELQRMGFRPENMVGCELLPECAQVARHLLPAAVRIIEGDALELQFPSRSFDVVMQATVFSSILDCTFQHRLASRMWDFAKPGGGILWYDFVYNNPKNPDVRGVPLRRIRALFPHGKLMCWRITLAPPICRIVTRVHPSLYNLFNLLPILRTHILCWIERPALAP